MKPTLRRPRPFRCRPMTLQSQVLLANLILITVAVVVAILATNPTLSTIPERPEAGLVLGIAVALSIAVNLYMLSERMRPLERLTEAMDTAELVPGQETHVEGANGGGALEVRRLHRAFRRMLERLEDERRHAARAALAAQEQERSRIARDLHDEVNQALTGLLLRLEAIRSQAPPELAAELAETRQLANQAMQELLALSHELRPTALDDLGLEAALGEHTEELARTSGLDVRLELDGSVDDLPPEAATAVYRIAQESLSNAVRHAKPTRLGVSLARTRDEVVLSVSDDGAGFDPDAQRSLGMRGMQERALLVGALLSIDSAPGQGTTVALRVPAAGADGGLDEGADS